MVIGLVGLLVDGVFLRNLLPTGTLGNLFSGGSVALLNVAVGVEVACGMRRGQWQLAGLYLLVALALAGLPPFGTALGKSLCEEAIGSGWASALFLLASAATGGAVLRAGVRCFTRWGAARSHPPTRRGPAKARRSRTRSCAGRRRACTSRSPSCCWAAWRSGWYPDLFRPPMPPDDDSSTPPGMSPLLWDGRYPARRPARCTAGRRVG
ncbi:hypothetical protein A4G29_21555 [Mycobacterium kansasii]|nr:hypothetical protein A4G29_21555 [Mycobacterium kansasii]